MTRIFWPMVPTPKPTPEAKELKPLVSKQRAVNRKAKIDTFERDEYLCQWCRIPGGALDPHHRLRRSQGGKDIPAHMVTVHRLCHGYIHDHPAEATERGFLVTSVEELAKRWE